MAINKDKLELKKITHFRNSEKGIYKLKDN